MTRKIIKIKEREVDIPMSVNQLYWSQYKKLIQGQVDKGLHLDPLEVVIAILGEDQDYWRSKEDVNEFIQVSGMLYKIYQLVGARTRRTELNNILINGYLPKKKKLPFWKRIKSKSDGISKTEIRVDDKEYNAEFETKDNILWKSNGQYLDALDVAKVVHSESDISATIEAWERLFKIYFYPIITGEEYEVEKAYQLDISRVRWSDVVDFGGFFLIKLNRFPFGTKKKLPKLATRMTNLEQDSTKLARSTSLGV